MHRRLQGIDTTWEVGVGAPGRGDLAFPFFFFSHHHAQENNACNMSNGDYVAGHALSFNHFNLAVYRYVSVTLQ